MSLSFIRCNFGRILYQLINDELILMKYKPTRLQEVQMVSICYMLRGDFLQTRVFFVKNAQNLATRLLHSSVIIPGMNALPAKAHKNFSYKNPRREI